jgi:hypothetical protein
MILTFSNRIEVVESYQDLEVRSPNAAFLVPAVLRMTRYFYPRKVPRSVRFSREHVFARDDFRCQYCLDTFSSKDLTLDHVVPLTKGGPTSWSNIVTCCVACNQKKGAKSPAEAGLHLHQMPREPKTGFLPDLIYYRGARLPEVWRPYVGHLAIPA